MALSQLAFGTIVGASEYIETAQGTGVANAGGTTGTTAPTAATIVRIVYT